MICALIYELINDLKNGREKGRKEEKKKRVIKHMLKYPYKDLLCSFLDDLASRSAKNPCSNCKQEIEKNFLKSSIKVDVILQADYACGGGDLALPVVLRTVNFSVASCPVSTIWSGADVSDQIRQFK